MGLFKTLWQLSLVEKGTREDGEQSNSILSLNHNFGRFPMTNVIKNLLAEKSARGAGEGPAVPGYNEESCPKICHPGAPSSTE